MGPIVEAAAKIAVAHCPCRMSANILGRSDCRHSLEVCIKYDELADFVISKGLAREISKDEAHHILAASEKEGLVHMVDNAQGTIKHTCNCCGHYCWNVGIIRRRKIPRDMLMAVYFIRDTDLAECIGCGACVAACPNASAMLFVAAKVSHLCLLPQGHPERARRALDMVRKMDELGFGNCSNERECEAACPKGISIRNIARLNREFLKAAILSDED